MSRLSRWLFLGCAILVSLVGTHAFGQGPGGDRGGRRGPMMMGGGMFGGGGGGGDMTVMLLGQEAVQKELELVDDQKAKLRSLAEESRKEMMELYSGIRDMTPEQRQAKINELRPKMEAKLAEMAKKTNEILLPHQQDRLKQLSIQRRGAWALADAKVQEELKLTEEQKQKLQQIRDKLDQSRRSAMPSGNPRDMSEEERAKMRERFEGMFKATEDAKKEALAILTADQNAAFEKMQGAKFEFPQFRGPGGPGGPGGRGPGGGDRPQN